jgi:nucleoside-diphosphate-sugar epimerase
MSLNNQTVFLAGASGMTGTSILRYILAHYPTTRIRAAVHSTDPAVVSDRVEVVRGDLRDLADCRRMAAGCHCAIMSAAYAGGARYTTQSPFEHTRENLVMNRQMLEAFHLEGVQRIVFIGSAVIYQAFEGYITEDELDFNQDPHGAYFGFAWAMRFLEKMCWYLHDQFGHEVVMVRAANIFGPRDKFDAQRSNFIPAIIRKAVDKMDPFELWGTPEVIRDVIFCDDFAKAVVLLADDQRITCDVFNGGTGVKTTVGKVAEWALKYAQHQPAEIKWIQDKPMIIGFRALDCSKLKQAMGWEPDHTIEQGVEQTVTWWMQNRERWSR